MVSDYPSTVSRQSSGKAKQGRQKFHEVTLLEVWNSDQEFTIPYLNRNSEHRKYRHC